MSASAVILCRDCKFFDAQEKRCRHRSAYEFSVVTGESTYKYAEAARMDTSYCPDDRCGQNARYFEARSECGQMILVHAGSPYEAGLFGRLFGRRA